MKHLTIRTKVTLWFIVILTVIVGLSYALFWFTSESVMRNMVLNDLQNTVDYNLDQVVSTQTRKAPKKDPDSRFIRYRDGYLKIDKDFIDLVDGAGIGLFGKDGKLLYGEDLIPDVSGTTPFHNHELQTVRSGPDVFFVYDRKLKLDDAGVLWLRGSVDRDQRQEEISQVFHFALFLLPVLILLASAGGYLITKRSLKPIGRMVEAAGSISSGSDLKLRLDMGEGADEVHQLAGSFDGMMQRLEEAFEAEKQFTSDVSHELRTPMATIMAQCELALEDRDLTREEARDALELIQRQGSRMNDMISDMLTYTRIDRGHERYPFETVDLSLLVREVCGEFAAVHGEKAEIDMEIRPEIRVHGNDLLLRRLLNNLLENAVRYGRTEPTASEKAGQAPAEGPSVPAPAQIRVLLERTGDKVLLTVGDRGMGISEEHLERIFDRFYQVDPSRSSEGSGLGLAIVKEIALIHGGGISVESSPGQGSAFTVTLPPLA